MSPFNTFGIIKDGLSWKVPILLQSPSSTAGRKCAGTNCSDRVWTTDPDQLSNWGRWSSPSSTFRDGPRHRKPAQTTRSSGPARYHRMCTPRRCLRNPCWIPSNLDHDNVHPRKYRSHPLHRTDHETVLHTIRTGRKFHNHGWRSDILPPITV